MRKPIAWAPCFLVLVCGLMPASHGDSPAARLTGAFWWMSEADVQRPQESWRAELDQIQALGMDLLVVSGAFADDAAAAMPDGHGAEPLKGLFDEADRRGMRIFVNTLSIANWWTQTDAAPEIARAEKCIGNIARLFRVRKSFCGWYVPYELYMFWDREADLTRTLYREVASRCKAALDKPVMISPFFILDQAHKLGDFRWASPEEYQGFWTGVLRQAPIDIVALQDSGEHLSCYTLDERKPFFAAMKAACDATGKSFWANVESAELEIKSIDDYAARFGLRTHVNDSKTVPFWRAVPAAKFKEKLQFAGEFTGTAITWGYQEYVRPGSKPDAKALYESYLALELTSR